VPDYTNVLVKVVAIFGVINRVHATTPAHKVFCYSVVAHILTPSVNLAFGPNSGFKNKCRNRAVFGLGQALKWGPFTTLCGHVCKGQQGEIEVIHSLDANKKNVSVVKCLPPNWKVGCSPQSPRQGANFRLKPAANCRHQN